MTYLELLQESPSLFFVLIIASLALTVLVYGAFPVICAKTRKAPITKKKYKRLCYGINVIGLIFFVAINGAVSGGPYFLWTWIFSNWGVKNLSARGIMTDSEYLADDPNRLTECKSCGYRDKDYFDDCPKCGHNAKRYVYINQEAPASFKKICFCKECGENLGDNSNFCRNCGTKIKTEEQS